MVDVWSPIFTIMMFEMANLRSALFRVPFLQFSLGEGGAESQEGRRCDDLACAILRGEARAKPRGLRHFTTKFEDLYILAKSVAAVTSKWSYRYYGLFFCREFCLRVSNFSQYFSPIFEQSIKIFLALFVISLEFR